MNISKNILMKLCVLIMIAMATLTTACGNLDDGYDDEYGYDDYDEDYDSYDDCDSYYEECEDDSISATEAATILIILGRL